MSENIAYVIPTMDRPDDMRRLLGSLEKQTRLPDQVIVVDASDPQIKSVCDEFPDLDITYVREFPPSLARQRNVGMAALRPEITVAGYLDDDLELEPDATEVMAAFWEEAGDDVGGASIAVVNNLPPRRKALARFFMMYGDQPGGVLRSSFQCPIPYVKETVETKWLYGGATLWRRCVIDEFDYDEWYAGHGYGEDYDYSYRVGRKYRLFVVGGSRTWHHHHPMSDAKMYALGRQQTYNRMYLVRKLGDFPPLFVAWGVFGLVFMNFLALLRHPGQPTRDRFRGNLRGLFEAFKAKRESFMGYWKD